MRYQTALSLLCLPLVSFAQPCALTGKVTTSGGAPLTSGGVVKIYSESAGPAFTVVVGIGDKAGPDEKPGEKQDEKNDQRGRYSSGNLSCGKLELRVDAPGYRPHIADVATTSASVYDVTLYALPPNHDETLVLGAIGLLIAFGLSLMLVRWHNIAKVDQKLLWAETEGTKLAIRLEVPASQQQMFLSEADQIMLPVHKEGWPRVLDVLFWTRGEELAAWARLRDLQRQVALTWDLRMVERIRARLSGVGQQLRAFKDPGAVAIADEIADALKQPTSVDDRWRQLLGVGLGALNARREEEFAVLTGWQTKGVWMATVALVLIAATVYARPPWAVLFLMGAVGGLLSRLGRALTSTQTPSDYGASWITLFLSPVSGALAGWFGYLLILGFVGLNILSGSIQNMLTCSATANCGPGDSLPSTAWAFAFILGFSERLFERLVGTIDKTLIPGSTPAGPANAPGASSATNSSAVPSTSTSGAAALPSRMPMTMPGGVAAARIDSVMVRPDRLMIMGVGLTAAEIPAANITLQFAQEPPIHFDEQSVEYDRGTVITVKLPQQPKLPAGAYGLLLKTRGGTELSKVFQIT